MLDNFYVRMSRRSKTQAEVYRQNAEIAIDSTFTRDPAYKNVFVTHAPSGINRKRYDAKFYIDTRRSIAGDSENYTLMFRPHVRVPIGSYVDIPDDTGKIQRWLIILRDDQPQFPVYYILKCNWTLKWFVDGQAYKCLCVQRTQSSYNSGLWTDYMFTSPENQTIMFLPTTPYTQTINYGQRMLINDSGRSVPIAWHVSKIMDTIPVGLTRLTFAQVQADLHDDCGKFGLAGWCVCEDHTSPKSDICVMCKIAEPTYIDAGIEMPEKDIIHGKIVYNGKDNTIRVGGTAKTFSVMFWDDNTQTYINHRPYWKISLMDENVIVCSINVTWDDNSWMVNLAEDCPNEIELQSNNGDIVCTCLGKEVFKIVVMLENNNESTLKLKCSQLYNMVGKTIHIVAQNSAGQYTSELDIKVVS